MAGQSDDSHVPSATFDEELQAFAAELKDLWIASGAPALRKVAKLAPASRPLSPSGISEALNGTRLPELSYLIALVRILLSIEDGKPAQRDDPRVQHWTLRWQEMKRLKERKRTATASSVPATYLELQEVEERSGTSALPPAESSESAETPSEQAHPSADQHLPLSAAAQSWQTERGELRRALEAANTRIQDLVTALYDRIPDAGHSLGPTGTCWAIAFSPIADLLACPGAWEYDPDSVRLWDTAIGRPVGALLPHPGEIKALAFSSDGRLLASGCKQGSVRLWDPATGLPLGDTIPTGDSDVTALAFSPDGSLLATANSDGPALVWDVALGRHQASRPFGLHSSGVAFSPDGTLLAVADNSQGVSLWQTADWSEGPKLFGDQPLLPQNVAFSPDGHLLACGSLNGSVQLWNPFTGQSIGEPLKGRGKGFNSLAFSPDGSLLAVTDGDDVRLWNVNTRTMIGTQGRDPRPSVWSVAFSRDGRLMATGESTRVRLYRPPAGWPATSRPASAKRRRTWRLSK
ncbi:WD40 repeat domain-containing protein [Streptomyces sp. NPDC052107]|uniref:WD40 repeat domain-containing protein n=1 Tax=Streptomyces sp. NPDC052107 TaxID=3155632 RepID=UPI00343C9399